MTAIIEVEGLTKSYGSKRGIANVSFQVEEGEVFGYLGPNRAGKTTTIRLLMELLRADAGTACIAGLDCWQQSVEIKQLIGYLPGEPSLDPNLTGGQILEYFGHLRGGVDQAYLKQLIKRLDLDPSRKFRQYSSGNKRKIGLIQAFMHRPRLLILDEPTNGLDPLNQQEFDRMVKEVRDEGHRLSVLAHLERGRTDLHPCGNHPRGATGARRWPGRTDGHQAPRNHDHVRQCCPCRGV